MAQSLRGPSQPLAAECDRRGGRSAVLDAVGSERGGLDGVVESGEGVGEVQDAGAGCYFGGRGVGGELVFVFLPLPSLSLSPFRFRFLATAVCTLYLSKRRLGH